MWMYFYSRLWRIHPLQLRLCPLFIYYRIANRQMALMKMRKPTHINHRDLNVALLSVWQEMPNAYLSATLISKPKYDTFSARAKRCRTCHYHRINCLVEVIITVVVTCSTYRSPFTKKWYILQSSRTNRVKNPWPKNAFKFTRNNQTDRRSGLLCFITCIDTITCLVIFLKWYHNPSVVSGVMSVDKMAICNFFIYLINNKIDEWKKSSIHTKDFSVALPSHCDIMSYAIYTKTPR